MWGISCETDLGFVLVTISASTYRLPTLLSPLVAYKSRRFGYPDLPPLFKGSVLSTVVWFCTYTTLFIRPWYLLRISLTICQMCNAATCTAVVWNSSLQREFGSACLTLPGATVGVDIKSRA